MRPVVFFLFVLVGFPAAPFLAAQTDSGLAGSYPAGFSGKVTTSGEKYDPKAMTAAAPDLRLGMRLAVTNLANGRIVTVRVNDNRSLASGRMIDLSQAAAQALGLAEGEVAKVEIHALRVDEADVTKLPAPPPQPQPQPQPAEAVTTHQAFLPPVHQAYFQMGAFRTEMHAQDLALSLARRGDHPSIFRDAGLFRVFLIVKESEASSLVEKLTKEGRIGFFQVSKEPAGTSVKLTTE